MNALVVLILIGALGFVFGRFLFLRPRAGSLYERFILSGAEFLIIGAMLGPMGFRVIDESTLASLEPFMILALSWVGLLLGIQLRWGHLIRFPRAYFQLSIVHASVALMVTFGALAVLFFLWTPVATGREDLLRAALCLAAIATLSSPSEPVLHQDRSVHGGHLAGLLRFVAAVDPLVALVGVGFLFSFWHGGGSVLGLDLSSAEWMLASAAGGVILGCVFLLLLWSTKESDEVVLVVLGMALFSGGLASVFHLSPLVVCLIVGMILSNSRPHHERILHMFLRLERPLYVVLLVLAGATWRFDDPWGYLLAIAFVFMKFAAKYLGTRAAVRVTTLPFRVPRQWWLGTVPQGAMAIAIAVSYGVAYDDPMSQIVFSSVLVSTVMFALLSRALVESALRPDDSEGES